jgi:hypothetical protein
MEETADHVLKYQARIAPGIERCSAITLLQRVFCGARGPLKVFEMPKQKKEKGGAGLIEGRVRPG